MDRRTFCKLLGITALSTNPLFAFEETNNAPLLNTLIDHIFIDEKDTNTMLSLNKKLKNLQSHVGGAEFSLLGLDDAIKYTKRFQTIGEFTKDELTLIEKLFYTPATDYGFLGEKVFLNLSDNINRKDVTKIPKIGQYIYNGTPYKKYTDIIKEVGADRVILTSGTRGIIKQLELFTSKTISLNGCLSVASQSLAPVGYSFHAVGDFDIGKIGFGEKNFTEEFANTSEYKDLIKLGYVDIRYPDKNPFGVIFEPWHIKVV